MYSRCSHETEKKRKRKPLSLGVEFRFSRSDPLEMQQQRERSEEAQDNSSGVEENLGSNADEQLKIKDKIIESLKCQADEAKKLELQLTERDASLDIMKREQDVLKSSMADSSSEAAKRIKELEGEVERRKESGARLFDQYVSQTTQLEQATVLLEKYKFENNELREKLQSSLENVRSLREEIEKLNAELLEERDNLACALQGEKAALSRAQSLLEEMGSIKNELRLAMEAEEKSKRAMDDLAMALKEVATEAAQAKEKLASTEKQLKIVEEAERLKSMHMTTEDDQKNLLSETKKENERLKNTAERLRLEAEESLLAWNEKEIELVKCIKQVEEERAVAQEENHKLKDSLSEIEAMSEKANDENQKLRDLLQQALNEANVAKEAAEAARAENSQLKDSLAEKDKALAALAQENECLKINEAATNETIKELKRVISTGSKKELKTLEKTLDDKEGKKPEKEHHKSGRRLSGTFNFDLKELRIPVPGMPPKPNHVEDELERDDALTDSIFDLVEPPAKEPPHGSTSSACTEDEKAMDLEEMDQQEVSNLDDMESDKNPHTKKRVLLKKFGDLLKRKNQSQAHTAHEGVK
ncbi:hypothetical protein Ancab_003478 [Ancistrocladus abbreviatus]